MVVGGDGCWWLLVLVAVLVMVIVMLVAFINKETIRVSLAPLVVNPSL